jgi:aryl-alcohol dehydrogenase
MKIKAAVLYDAQTPFRVEQVDLEEPQEGEVLVKLVGTGLCHTDLGVARSPNRLPMPMVLGHEGAGVVEEVGSGVTTVKPGDHVVLTAVASCGKCRQCVRGRPYLCEFFSPWWFSGMLPGCHRRLRKDGQELNHFFFQSSFAEYAVVPQEAAVRVREEAPLETIGLLGCGGLTGIGSVVNTARVEAGASVAIFGCGGVGMSAVMAAKLVGAGKIIAVDVLDKKLRLAEELGATHTINATREDVAESIRKLTIGGADYAIMATTNAVAAVQAIEAIGFGGTCVVIGAPPRETKVDLDFWAILMERTIKGCILGSSRATLDIPLYIDLYLVGRLPLDKLVTKRYPLTEINAAFESLEKGEEIKIIIMP